MLVVGCAVLVAGEVQTEFVDHLRALANPFLPGLGGDVGLDPFPDGALEGGGFELRAVASRPAAGERARGGATRGSKQ